MIRIPVGFLAVPWSSFVGVDTYKDLETRQPWVKFTLYRISTPAAADAHFCHCHSDPNLLSLFLSLVGGRKIFHLQTVVLFDNGNVEFPELPVTFSLMLGCVLSWSVILHCLICFGDIGTKLKEWFYTPLLLTHNGCYWGDSGTWYLHGGQ